MGTEKKFGASLSSFGHSHRFFHVFAVGLPLFLQGKHSSSELVDLRLPAVLPFLRKKRLKETSGDDVMLGIPDRKYSDPSYNALSEYRFRFPSCGWGDLRLTQAFVESDSRL